MNLLSKLAISALVALVSCKYSKDPEALSGEDRSKILQSLQDYRDAWIKNDTAAIMNFVSPDMILYMPNSTGKSKIGKDSIRAFWFLNSDLSYPITEYEVRNEQLEGNSRICIYSGISRLSWHLLRGTIRSDSSTVVSEFMNVLRKEENQWKLFRIMYNIKDKDYR